MPQIVVWPLMARTMVEDVHGVKPLPGPANRACRDGGILFDPLGLTQP
jgi:hypothetical protein